MMVEAEATDNVIELIAGGAEAPTEAVVAEGLEAAKPFIAALCEAQKELADKAAKATARLPAVPRLPADDVYAAVAACRPATRWPQALTIAGKHGARRPHRRDQGRGARRARPRRSPAARRRSAPRYRSLTKKLVRQRILTDHFRIDGRGLTDIRALSAEVAVIPRAHGSALFERGETQILGVTTLNMVKMAQQIDSLGPETSKRYMHHYNFPPYSTGETGRVGSPKRREIGHGALAERALMPVLPSVEEFPYAIRQVSEALELQRLDVDGLGVRLDAVAAQRRCAAEGAGRRYRDGPGLRRRSTARPRYVTLTDILGAEDAFGDMDFKVAGTKEFVTALQLDTKLDGIPVAGAGRCADAGQGRPPDHPRGHGRGHRRARRDEPVRAAGHRDQDPGRQDRRGHRAQGQDDQLDQRARPAPRSRSRTTARCSSAPPTARRPQAAIDHDQRDRQPAAAQGRRAVPRNRGQDHRFRRVRLAAARP